MNSYETYEQLLKVENLQLSNTWEVNVKVRESHEDSRFLGGSQQISTDVDAAGEEGGLFAVLHEVQGEIAGMEQ
jgi:hypothetical protein